MKIEDFDKYYNHTTDTYEFFREDLEKILENISTPQKTIKITENGTKIIAAMQKNQEKYINVFTAKNLGELLFMSPRSISGSMKKLIADGFVEKVGANPVAYGLTKLGKSYEFDKE